MLIRHGETEWSRSGQHTGRTDIALTDLGREQADALGAVLGARRFALVLTSPLQRAMETCKRAGLATQAVSSDDLVEWDYGVYEGRRTADIRIETPDWTIWTHPVVDGETVAEIGVRADRVICACRDADGDIAIFAHGHMLRVLTARWLDLPPAQGRLFALDTATVSVLGHERETAVIRAWNQPGGRGAPL